MQFYTIKAATSTSETGSVYPQIHKMAPGYDYDAPNSVYALSRASQSLPSFIPNLDHFVMQKKAVLSDILSASVIYGGFLISEKLKNIFIQFNLPVHKFYDATVLYKENLFHYYWMHIICDLSNEVDYTRSLFFIYYNYSHNLGRVEVNSKAELMTKENKLKKDNPEKTVAIWAEKISLKDNFKSLKTDFFKIGLFDSSYYINEKLKIRLVKEKVTGALIAPATNLIIQ